MPFWVYILECSDGSYYTGHTDNLELRIGMHREGKIDGYTATRLPVTLVFSEQFVTRLEALEMEMRIKGWSRKKKEAVMRGDWKEVQRLAKNRIPNSTSQPVHGSTSSPRTVDKEAIRPELVEGPDKRKHQ